MKIAVLLKFDEKDQFILDYLNKQLVPLQPEIHMIHVEQVSGEVPLKIDGSVLDVCTEFDLSKHLVAVEEKKLKMNQLLTDVDQVKRIVVAGNPLSFIQYYTKLHEIELVFSGSHVKSWTEMLESSFASQVSNQLEIPMLSLKCDRSEDDLRTIGVIVDDAEMNPAKLQVVVELAKKHNAKVKLIRTPEHMSDKIDGSLFPNEIEKMEVSVPGFVNDHDFHKCTSEHEIDLLVVFRRHPSLWKKMFKSDKNNYLLNHLQLPLLII